MRWSNNQWDADRVTRLIARLLINAAAIWAASHLITGITPLTDIRSILLVALIFGVVNALIKPVFALLTCPLEILTLGLFTLIVNAAMLGLTSWIAEQISIPFGVDGFIAALLGAIVVSIISWLLSAFV